MRRAYSARRSFREVALKSFKSQTFESHRVLPMAVQDGLVSASIPSGGRPPDHSRDFN